MRKRTNGLALVMVMMALGLLAVTTLGISYLGNLSLLQSKRQFQTDEALFAAQAGARVKVAQVIAGDDTDISGTLTNSDATYSAQVFDETSDPVEWANFGLPTGADLHYVVCEGESSNGKRRSVAMLVRKSNSDFNLAALASKKIELVGGSFTQTYTSDPINHPLLPSDHQFATVAVTDSKGEIKIENSWVGYDGIKGIARLFAPTGAVESDVVKAGSAGTNFASFNVDPALAPTDPLDTRAFEDGLTGTKVEAIGATAVETISPVWVNAGPDGVPDTADDLWELGRKEIIVKDLGKVILDITMLEPDQVARFNFKSLEIKDGGSIELLSANNARCEFYVHEGVEIVGGGIVNPTNIPERFLFLVNNGDVKIKDDSTSYMCVKAPTKKVEISEAEIRGAVVADEVIVKDAGKIYFDKALTGADMGANKTLVVSYQEL